MSILWRSLAIGLLVLTPCHALARGSPTRRTFDPSEYCGWKSGSLPDPAETRRCLEERFERARAKPGGSGGAQPPSNNPPDSQPKH